MPNGGVTLRHATDRLQLLDSGLNGDVVRVQNAAGPGCLSPRGQNTVTTWGGISNVVRNRLISWGLVAFLLRADCSFEVVIGW